MTKNLNSDLFDKWMNGSSIESDLPTYNSLNSEEIGEFCFYKYIDHPEKDAEIASASDIKNAIDYFKENNIQNVVLHFGHYFNADYDELFTLLHFFKSWYSGKIIAFSPEEIVFLAIVGDKNIDEVIAQIKAEEIQDVLGFLPESVFKSNYYADDDELFIDDRHVVLSKLLANNFTFIYPFNLGQVETIEEFNDMVDFVKSNNINNLIIQPNKPVDAEVEFDYNKSQLITSQLFDHFILPERALTLTKNYFTDKSFEIRFKYAFI